MAQITNQTLTLTPFFEDRIEKVTIEVTYNAVFSPSERGLSFLETIQVLGVDSPPTPDEILVERILPVQEIAVTAGSGPLTVQRTRTIKALRTLLQEDPGPNTDEIRCKIQIFSTAASGFTPVKFLAG